MREWLGCEGIISYKILSNNGTSTSKIFVDSTKRFLTRSHVAKTAKNCPPNMAAFAGCVPHFCSTWPHQIFRLSDRPRPISEAFFFQYWTTWLDELFELKHKDFYLKRIEKLFKRWGTVINKNWKYRLKDRQ